MKKRAFSVAAVAGVLLFGGCDKPSENAQPGAGATKTPSSSLTEAKPTPENTVVIVNGKPVSKALFQSIMAELAQRNAGQSVPEDKVLEGLISRELLYQEAEKLNLANDPAVTAKLEKTRQDVLVQAEVEHFRKITTVPDEEIKKEYDTVIASMAGGNTEYKARHILLESEEAAKDVLAKLQKGGKFEELAKKQSKDPRAKQSGGELGWFGPQQHPELSAALAGLKNGEVGQTPVQSKSGWHVIQREESREQPVPPFDAVKDHLRARLLAQKLQKHVEEMKATAKIERLAPAKPAEPPKAETAPPSANPSAVSEAGQPVKPATPPAPSAPEKPAQ